MAQAKMTKQKTQKTQKKLEIKNIKDNIRVLQTATALLEMGWNKGASAVTKKGDTCSPFSEFAAKFCMSGAISRAAYSEQKTVIDTTAARVPIRKILKAKGWPSMVSFNDYKKTKLVDVLDVYEGAMRSLRAKLANASRKS